jgi:hypothetical protein
MLKGAALAAAAAILLAAVPVSADVPNIEAISRIARCQKKIASAGAKFAQQVIRNTLKCTNEVAECQIQCDLGVFGPPCDTNPPPCCDPDDPNSMFGFQQCMAAADELCGQMDAKITTQEIIKQGKISTGCSALTQDELCGAQGNGLNFATLNAGCLALNPGYTCDLPSLIQCVGGPLERQLVDQISAVLDARAGDAVAALNLQAVFPGIPIPRKVKGQVAAGKVDVWSFSGQAGDEVKVRVMTRDDNGDHTSNLRPIVTLVGSDNVTPVADTNIKNVPCSVPNVCGSTCPVFNRVLPYTGTFNLAIQAGGGGCTGGRYRLIVVSPGGAIPIQVADDIDP